MLIGRLRSALASRLAGALPEVPAPEAASLVLNLAPAHVRADLSLPFPMQAAKLLKRKPLDLAAELAGSFKDIPELESVEAAPPGFLSLRLSAAALGENLSSALAGGAAPGMLMAGAPRRVLLEFVSANPTGPVHVASGRAATLGDSLARILRRRGHEIATVYYVNDAGKQVRMLGQSVKARFEQAQGRSCEVPEGGYQGEYVKELAAAVPAEASGWEAEDFGRFAVGRMLEGHRLDMEAFGVRFDRWFLESELHACGAVEKTLAALRSLGHVYEKEGAVWLGSSAMEAEDDKDRVLVRADGRPTYFLADIAYHQDKLERGFSELIDIWGADHHGYVPRMQAAVEALGRPKGTLKIIIHQLVHLFRGKEAVKMSKRAGEFVTLAELVREAGIDACRFFFALRGANVHMNFDLELAKRQSQENPVYYVQYVHARIRSIFREAESRGLRAASERWALLGDESERALLVKLAWFPEALAVCERELSPHPLASYLMELAGLYHPFYERCRVVDEGARELSEARLALCAGTAAVIGDGLGLLGVSAPEKM